MFTHIYNEHEYTQWQLRPAGLGGLPADWQPLGSEDEREQLLLCSLFVQYACSYHTKSSLWESHPTVASQAGFCLSSARLTQETSRPVVTIYGMSQGEGGGVKLYVSLENNINH